MAMWKNSFILYKDLLSTFEMLTDAEAWKLIKHLLLYVNDKEPTLDDRMLSILFQPIKENLKRDLKKREDIKEKRVIAWKLWGRGNNKQKKQMLLSKAKKAVTVTVTDTVNVTDSVINKEDVQTHTHDENFIETGTDQEIKKAPEEPAYDKTARIARQRHAEKYSTFLARTWEKHTGKETLVTDTLKRRVLTISDTMPAADLEKFMETYGELYNFIETHDLRKHIYYPIRQYDLEKFLEKINIFTTDSFTVLGNITVKESTSKVLALWKKDHNIVDERTPPPPPVEEKVELTAEQKQKAKDKLQGFKKNLVDKVTT